MDFIDNFMASWEKLIENNGFSDEWLTKFPDLSQQFRQIYEKALNSSSKI